jgi:hypothetical protein
MRSTKLNCERMEPRDLPGSVLDVVLAALLTANPPQTFPPVETVLLSQPAPGVPSEQPQPLEQSNEASEQEEPVLIPITLQHSNYDLNQTAIDDLFPPLVGSENAPAMGANGMGTDLTPAGASP